MAEQSGRRTVPEPRDDAELAEAVTEALEEEAADTALLGDREPVDEVDAVEEEWAPGEAAPGIAADEMLAVHLLTEHEAPPEALDVVADELELPVPDADAAPEEAREEDDPATALHRTTRAGDLETRFEEFDPGIE